MAVSSIIGVFQYMMQFTVAHWHHWRNVLTTSMKVQASESSEVLVHIYQPTWCHISEDHNL